jgi:large subunit ribosomal protein L29
MKASKVRELTGEELTKKEQDIREELFRLRFQHVTGQLENPMRLRHLRRDLARTITVGREKAAAERDLTKLKEKAG